MLYAAAIGIVCAILAGMWLMLEFVGEMLDHAWQPWREERSALANHRPDGGEPHRGKGQSV